ncbi:BRO-N domain-containing protein [Methylorubrum thiocyanatum]|uniref:BRO-N domain-containing protein n=1 Tax=Methylorubrum thiocyanatum TaxID=47958 RepID=UPI0035C80AE3
MGALPGRYVSRLADDERRYIARTSLALPAGKPMVAVSESGFFKLVLRSDKHEALAFQEWVTREVLPAIRHTGGYRLAGKAPEAVEEGTVAEMPDVGGVMAELRSMRRGASFCQNILSH